MITLSHLSDVNDVKDAHKRVAYAVRTAALPVTMTTLCHVIPFAIGITSKYYVTKLVCIYFGKYRRITTVTNGKLQIPKILSE